MATISIELEIPEWTERSNARDIRHHSGRAANVLKLMADRLANGTISVGVDHNGIRGDLAVETAA
jgi:hypothetical protein